MTIGVKRMHTVYRTNSFRVVCDFVLENLKNVNIICK